MGLLNQRDYRNKSNGCGFNFAAVLVLVALIAFAFWAIRREITGEAKPEVDTAANLVTSHKTATPMPEPTENYPLQTARAGEALDIEQRIAINAQVLANEQLAGTLQAAEATLEASIKLTDAAASRQIAELAVTESAHVAQMEMAAQAVEDAETAKIEHDKLIVLAQIETVSMGILKVFFPFLGGLIVLLVVVFVMVTARDDMVARREAELYQVEDEPEDRPLTDRIIIPTATGSKFPFAGDVCTDEQLLTIVGVLQSGHGLSVSHRLDYLYQIYSGNTSDKCHYFR